MEKLAVLLTQQDELNEVLKIIDLIPQDALVGYHQQPAKDLVYNNVAKVLMGNKRMDEAVKVGNMITNREIKYGLLIDISREFAKLGQHDKAKEIVLPIKTDDKYQQLHIICVLSDIEKMRFMGRIGGQLS